MVQNTLKRYSKKVLQYWFKVIVIDMADPVRPIRLPFTADSAIMNPTLKDMFLFEMQQDP